MRVIHVPTSEMLWPLKNSLAFSDALVGYASSRRAVVPEEITKQPGQSDAELQREYQREMAESQKSAISAAVRPSYEPRDTTSDAAVTAPSGG